MIYFLGFRKLVFEIIFTPRFNGVSITKKRLISIDRIYSVNRLYALRIKESILIDLKVMID